ncbi:MAG TPA: helix-turn-helix domain-containing protein [Bryobacteraceae bacterium]|nr:helix-turn-helix domain-containing protein [Bryobacteraceae bacterium]
MKDRFDALVEHLLTGNIFLEQAIEVLERGMIQGALDRHERNQSAAAKQLGIHRNTLQRKMVEYGLGNGRARVRRRPAGTAARPRRPRSGAA